MLLFLPFLSLLNNSSYSVPLSSNRSVLFLVWRDEVVGDVVELRCCCCGDDDDPDETAAAVAVGAPDGRLEPSDGGGGKEAEGDGVGTCPKHLHTLSKILWNGDGAIVVDVDKGGCGEGFVGSPPFIIFDSRLEPSESF